MNNLEMITKVSLSLNFLKDQTEELCLTSVKEDGLALKFVIDQNENICIEVVK